MVLNSNPPQSDYRTEGLDHAKGASTGFMVASGGVLSEGYGHEGPGVCLGDGQTEDEAVPSQSGRGDALLRRMPPYPTRPDFSVPVRHHSSKSASSSWCRINVSSSTPFKIVRHSSSPLKNCHYGFFHKNRSFIARRRVIRFATSTPR